MVFKLISASQNYLAGLSKYAGDFMIPYLISTGYFNETIAVREQVFRDLAAGYLEGASSWITADERAALVDGAIVLTFEQAVRFLSDFLDGDSYFKVDDPEHNLRRARAQLRLLERLLERENDLVAMMARL